MSYLPATLAVVLLWFSIPLQTQALPYQILEDTLDGFEQFQVQDESLIGLNNAYARIWKRSTLRPELTFRLVPESPVVHLPNGQALPVQHPQNQCKLDLYQDQLISACDTYAGLRFWDLKTGQLISELREDGADWIAESHHTYDAPQRFYYGRINDQAIRLRQQTSLKVWGATHQLLFEKPQPGPILKMVSSRKWVALLLLDQSLRVYDLQTGRLHWSRPPQQSLRSIALDQNKLVIATDAHELLLFDLRHPDSLEKHDLLSLSNYDPQAAIQRQSRLEAGPAVGVVSIGPADYVSPSSHRVQTAHAFESMTLQGQSVYGLHLNQILMLDLKTHRLKTYALPDFSSSFPYIPTEMRVIGKYLFVWVSPAGRNKQVWALDPATNQWFDFIPGDRELQQKDRLLHRASGNSFPAPPRFQLKDYYTVPAGRNIPVFSGVVSSTQQQDSYTIAHGSDSVLQVWDLKQRRLQQEIRLPYTPQKIAFNRYAIAIASTVSDQPAVQLYYPPDFKLTQALDGPDPGSEMRLHQNIRLKNDQLWLLADGQHKLSIWQLPHAPHDPLAPLKNITPTDYLHQIPSRFESQSQAQYLRQFIEPFRDKEPALARDLQSHFSINPDIFGWQVTSAGLWYVQRDLKDKGFDLYLYGWSQAEPRLFADLPEAAEILTLEPERLIYQSEDAIYRLDLRTANKQIFRGASHTFNRHEVLKGKWLVQEKEARNSTQKQIHLWSLDQPEKHLHLDLPDSMGLFESYRHPYGADILLQQRLESPEQDAPYQFSLFRLNLSPLSISSQALSTFDCQQLLEPDLPMYSVSTWLNWQQGCYQLQSSSIDVRDTQGNALAPIVLNTDFHYGSIYEQINDWVFIDTHKNELTGSSLVNLKTGQQMIMPEHQIRPVRSGPDNLILRLVSYQFNDDKTDKVIQNHEPDHYLTLSMKQLSHLTQWQQFKAFFYPQGAILIAPTGHYAGWGDYQQYLHFADAQGQMIPWQEAERRWHKASSVQNLIQTMLQETPDNHS